MKNGNGHDDDWNNLGKNVRSYMSHYRIRQPGEPEADTEVPPQDPREATEFGAVWDTLCKEHPRIIDFINGVAVDPILTLTEIAGAFYEAVLKDRAIIPEQILNDDRYLRRQTSRATPTCATTLSPNGKRRTTTSSQRPEQK